MLSTRARTAPGARTRMATPDTARRVDNRWFRVGRVRGGPGVVDHRSYATLTRPARGDDLVEDIGDRPCACARHGAPAPGQPDMAPGEVHDRYAGVVALQPSRHGGRRDDRRPEALESEGGHELHAVDLGQGVQRH